MSKEMSERRRWRKKRVKAASGVLNLAAKTRRGRTRGRPRARSCPARPGNSSRRRALPCFWPPRRALARRARASCEYTPRGASSDGRAHATRVVASPHAATRLEVLRTQASYTRARPSETSARGGGSDFVQPRRRASPSERLGPRDVQAGETTESGSLLSSLRLTGDADRCVFAQAPFRSSRNGLPSTRSRHTQNSFAVRASATHAPRVVGLRVAGRSVTQRARTTWPGSCSPPRRSGTTPPAPRPSSSGRPR